MSTSSIVSVRELIDGAFGDEDANKVNFKTIQTVLYILARQLRILERQVGIVGSINPLVTASNISITELKLKANLAKSKKKAPKPSEQTKTSKKVETKEKRQKSKGGPNIASADKKKIKDFENVVDVIEQQREQELRVVHQRANSREEAEKSPTPMASLESMEYVQYEKLLVVDRTPADDTKKGGKKKRRLSIVTQEQFEDLASKVKKLQMHLGIIGTPEFPDNIELMKDLRRGASLTDAMAALQLSARVGATEKTLTQMIDLITDICTAKGIELKPLMDLETQVLYQATEPTEPPESSKPQEIPKEQTNAAATQTGLDESPAAGFMKPALEALHAIAEQNADWIYMRDLNKAIDTIYDNITKTVTETIKKASLTADNALGLSAKLEKRMTNAVNLANQMEDLEKVVAHYADQINTLDTGLSSQMTNYQEQLTQMQHDLESGLENMAENLANVSGDPGAVNDLNNHLTNLQFEIDSANTKQNELKESQSVLFTNLKDAIHQIEILNDIKSDREEVADALKDKAGIDALNGLVTQVQFDAVRGDFEKRIGAAYNKFNNQEIVWQKAIDELQRNMDERAGTDQILALRNDIEHYLEKLRKRMNIIEEIVGEPRAAAISKQLFRDTVCISCSTPATMNIAEPDMIPPLPAFKGEPNDNKTKPKDDGDKLCYPNKPIPHTLDSRYQFCHRYCGGSHTTKTNAQNKPITGPTVRSADRNMSQDIEKDKVVSDENEIVPCAQCNINMEEEERGTSRIEPILAEDAGVENEFSSFNDTNALDNLTPPLLDED